MRSRTVVSVTTAVALVAGGVLLAARLGPARSVSCTATAPGAHAVRLDAGQARNAGTIAAVARQLGLADHAVTVALATALQESDLRNLDGGHLDSRGLFQQRPSQGWGTPRQVTTPTYAATAFYQRLRQVPGWQQLPVTVAAQAVQRSAFPRAYAGHEQDARVLARAYTGQLPAALSCRGVRADARPDRAALQRAADRELGPGGLTATGAADGWAAAAWLVSHAQAYGLTSVTTGGRRWTAADGRWVDDPAAPAGVGYA